MKRKITGLFFTFLLCVAAFNGFCQEKILLPLTCEMVDSVRAKGNLKLFDYYLSESFSIIINEKKNTNQYDYDATSAGKLDIIGENPSKKQKEFTKGDIGKLHKADGGVLEIVYPAQDNENITLIFVLNSKKNRFELASAVIDTIPYTFRSDEPPYLAVMPDKPDLFPNLELQAVPISEILNNPPQSRQGSAASSSDDNIQVPAGSRYGTVSIKGPGSLTKQAVIEYIRYRNPNASPRDIEKLVGVYFEEAVKEGINPDLAIAQMCRTTNFLGIERIMQTCNYAGFASTPEWQGRFSGGMRQGVIAHIQHLKGYTSKVRRTELKNPLVDPRWNMLDSFRGTIHTLEDLSKKWSPYNSRDYYNDIKNIINEMRSFSSRLDT